MADSIGSFTFIISIINSFLKSLKFIFEFLYISHNLPLSSNFFFYILILVEYKECHEAQFLVEYKHQAHTVLRFALLYQQGGQQNFLLVLYSKTFVLMN